LAIFCSKKVRSGWVFYGPQIRTYVISIEVDQAHFGIERRSSEYRIALVAEGEIGEVEA
jgi:hypothetical protein